MKQTVDLVIVESQALNLPPATTFFAPSINVSRFELVSVQTLFNFSGGATGTGAIRLQISNDNVNFFTLTSSGLSFSSTTTNHIQELQRIGFKFLRFQLTQNTGTGGTFKVIAHCTIMD
jgi:hypothetical protein